jgi:hypothetical protein
LQKLSSMARTDQAHFVLEAFIGIGRQELWACVPELCRSLLPLIRSVHALWEQFCVGCKIPVTLGNMFGLLYALHVSERYEELIKLAQVSFLLPPGSPLMFACRSSRAPLGDTPSAPWSTLRMRSTTQATLPTQPPRTRKCRNCSVAKPSNARAFVLEAVSCNALFPRISCVTSLNRGRSLLMADRFSEALVDLQTAERMARALPRPLEAPYPSNMFGDLALAYAWTQDSKRAVEYERLCHAEMDKEEKIGE